MRQILLPLLFIVLVSGCATTDRMTRSRPPILSDEYALLDDSGLDRPDDKALRRKLDEARRHYLLALKAVDQGKDAVAGQHFEAAMKILNDLVTYPDIYSNSDFTRLSESLIQDYEDKVTSIDSLDPNSSIFVLRDKMYQEIERLPVERSRYPVTKRRHAGSESEPVLDYELQIGLTDNTPVQQCIAFFTSEKGRKFFSRWLARTGRYFPLYERILEEEGAPQELRHLSMIESGLNPTAVSWAKAVGLWQFIPSTGQMYGLSINWWVDERRDPEKATRAAARYLKDLYADLGDWHLALAAYNCGPGRVKSAIAKANSRDYWIVRGYLPRETQQYVPLFIAATRITMDPEAFGFTGIQYEEPTDYHTVPLRGSYDLATIARGANTSVEHIKELNPELLRDRIPSNTQGGYALRVPIGTPGDLAAILNEIPTPEEPTVTFATHKVGRGESLAAIASRYGVSVDDIRSANSLSPKSSLRRGARLKIPIVGGRTDPDTTGALVASAGDVVDTSSTTGRGSRAAMAPAASRPSGPIDRGLVAEAPATPEERAFVTALGGRQPGGAQSVTTGATSVSPRAAASERPRTSIASTSAQRESAHPRASRATTAPAHTSVHVVSRGETMTGIARRYKVSVASLAEWNGLSRNHGVRTGQRLRLQATGGTPPATPHTASASRDDRPARASKRSATSTRYETHRVRRGESLTAIAERYGVSVDELRSWNARNISGGNLLAGATLRVYSDSPSKGDSKRASRASKSAPKSYTVRRGDSLQEIANRFGVSLKDLKANNPRLKRGNLQAGQRIRIGR